MRNAETEVRIWLVLISSQRSRSLSRHSQIVTGKLNEQYKNVEHGYCDVTFQPRYFQYIQWWKWYSHFLSLFLIVQQSYHFLKMMHCHSCSFIAGLFQCPDKFSPLLLWMAPEWFLVGNTFSWQMLDGFLSTIFW